MAKRFLFVFILVLLILATLLVYLFEETRQLTGSVRDAETQEPIQDADLAVAGNNTNTDTEGLYSIGIPRGKYTLVTQADGYEPAQLLIDGDDLFKSTYSIDIVLEPNLLTATIRDSETNKPIPNVRVLIGDQLVVTNGSGIAQARRVTNGTPVAVQALGYQPVVTQFTGQLDLDLPLVPNTVNVLVTDKYTSKAIANASIQTDEAQSTSDAQGQVVLRRVKPGSLIRVSAPGYENGNSPFLGSALQIPLRPNTLDGVITDAATGQPISGTQVIMGQARVTTNAKGVYHLDDVPAKSAITVRVPGYRRMQLEVSGTARHDIKLTPFLVKGIRIPFTANPDQVRSLIDMINKTELNAIVIDVKSEKGKIAWDTQVPLAKQIDAANQAGYNLSEVIERCRTQNIYCIARLAVFQDTLLANARPSLAIHSSTGAVFTESGGVAWANPYNSDVWNYNIALAKEVAALGFDEIQFDYIRFPGRANGITFGTENTEETRVAAITGFLERAQKELSPTGIFISADVFGLTTAVEDDQHIGQSLRDMGPYLDYISPMVYPDVWAEAIDLIVKGLGIRNCTEAVLCPYEIVFNSYKHATEKTTTKVRLWLQAYAGRGDYGVTQYRLQKKAADDAGSQGWMFWNGQGNYDPKIFDPPSK